MSGGGRLRTGSGAEFRAFFYRLSVPHFADGGGRTVSSGVRKGGREGGACSLRGGTTDWVRGTSHPDITSLVSPTWSIVMCSKSTGGVHCWRHARAHDLLWWPTSSMSSSSPSKLRTLNGSRSFWRFRANCPDQLSMVDLRGGIHCSLSFLPLLHPPRSIAFFLQRYQRACYLIESCFLLCSLDRHINREESHGIRWENLIAYVMTL